jgi:hypothetical protein
VAFRRWLGLDGVDIAIHLGVTFCLMAVVGVTDGPEALFPVIMMGSLVVLAVRRKLALPRNRGESGEEVDRLGDVEERLHYLEGLQDRVTELEERLDFTERLLTRQQQKERLPGGE